MHTHPAGARLYSQVVLALERLGADAADVLALVAVRQLVLGQRARVVEHLAAHRAAGALAALRRAPPPRRPPHLARRSCRRRLGVRHARHRAGRRAVRRALAVLALTCQQTPAILDIR